MKLDTKIDLVDLLCELSVDLEDQADKYNQDIDESLDEAIRTLICYLMKQFEH